jgi:hypothetical protein
VAAVTIATGANFPDALVVGSPGGIKGIPTLLTQGNRLAPAVTSDWLTRHASDLRLVYLAGGRAVLDQTVAGSVETITGTGR